MKARTLTIAGTFAKSVGFALATALVLAVLGETVNAALCCFQSEKEA
jgi:hypothetical protein